MCRADRRGLLRTELDLELKRRLTSIVNGSSRMESFDVFHLPLRAMLNQQVVPRFRLLNLRHDANGSPSCPVHTTQIIVACVFFSEDTRITELRVSAQSSRRASHSCARFLMPNRRQSIIGDTLPPCPMRFHTHIHTHTRTGTSLCSASRATRIPVAFPVATASRTRLAVCSAVARTSLYMRMFAPRMLRNCFRC